MDMNNEELRRLAIAGVETEIQRLQQVLSQLRGKEVNLSSDGARPTRTPRTMTPEARAKISRRMKARWAEIRKRKS